MSALLVTGTVLLGAAAGWAAVPVGRSLVTVPPGGARAGARSPWSASWCSAGSPPPGAPTRHCPRCCWSPPPGWSSRSPT
ncbi:hypothetical protein V2I01_13090 [Micromonospora sp. BRA006-A]|nr:hypothetical protein [Micromonospora sp. BRA006-A]